jgi:prevent-host-death family protein
MPLRKKILPDIDFTEDILPLSEFRSTIADCILKTRRTHRPILVTQNGRAASFLIDVADFQKMRETFELINDIRAAEAEIEHGEEITQDEFEAELKSEGWL